MGFEPANICDLAGHYANHWASGEQGWKVGFWLEPCWAVTQPNYDLTHELSNSHNEAHQRCNQPPFKSEYYKEYEMKKTLILPLLTIGSPVA